MISADEYEPLKGFLEWWLQNVWVDPGRTDESDPIRILERTELKAPARARQGLEMAINDIIESAIDFTPVEMAKIDGSLKELGLPTFSEVQFRFAKSIRKVLRHGQIRTEVEYYAVRNAAEIYPEPDRSRLWALIETYEANISSGSS